MELRPDRRPVQQLAAGRRHPFVRGLPGMLCKRPARVRRDEHIVAFLDQAESREGHADFGQDPTAAMSEERLA